MKDKKLTLIAIAALVCVMCVAAAVFATTFLQSDIDDLPDCTYKITNKQREMSTYDLLKQFCETEYMSEVRIQWLNAVISSTAPPEDPLCNDHQAYYELIRRDDLKEAYDKLNALGDECPKTLFIFASQEDVMPLLAD